jgi:hypothetical protein
MDARTVLALYRRVRNGENHLPEMDEGTFSLATVVRRFDNAETAYTHLTAFQPLQGWICFQSANRAFVDGRVPAMDGETGTLLAAEAAKPNGEALHVRYDGNGGWLATHYKLTEGADLLADTVEQVATGNLGLARYRRLWRPDTEHGCVPFAVCFVGFQQR